MSGDFRGPLFASWGHRMREPALTRMLEGAAGRTGIPTVDDRAAWQGVDVPTVEVIRRSTIPDRGTAWPGALASAFARYRRDGNRTEYEGAVSDRQQRLTRAVVLAAVTDDPGWLDEAVDGIVVLCEQSTWCWPAHDDAHSRLGSVLPDASSPYVDLGAGEVVAQLALADHVLGGRLDSRWPGLRERIRHESHRRVFGPFTSRDDFWWLGFEREVNNWNPWILGNVVLAAVLLVEDARTCARLVSRALESLDRFVATLPDDGAIDEGYSYWWYGACRLLECLDVVRRVTGGALDATDIRVVRETLRYPYRMHLGGQWYVNVADASARSSGREPWHIPFRWGRRVGDREVAAHATGSRAEGAPVVDVGAGLARVVDALVDVEWRDARPVDPPLPGAVWLGSVQVLVARERAGDQGGLALMVKGGHNGESHNHRDLGSFIVALDGRPLVVDIGKPTYTAQTFGPDRYENPVMQSSWHNTVAPFGMEQGTGARFAAPVLSGPSVADSSGSVSSVRLELANAYPLAPGDSWRREAGLDRAQPRVVVSDAWELSAQGGGPTSINLVLAGEVHVDDAVTRVRAVGATKGLRIAVTGGASDEATGREPVRPAVERWQLEDPELTDVWGPAVTRITFTAPRPDRGSLRTTIEPEP